MPLSERCPLVIEGSQLLVDRRNNSSFVILYESVWHLVHGMQVVAHVGIKVGMYESKPACPLVFKRNANRLDDVPQRDTPEDG